MGFILYITAKILFLIISGFSFLFNLGYFRLNLFKINKHYFNKALSLDQHGNVVFAHLLNYALAKRGGHLHGDEDETISFVVAINAQNGNLTKFGIFVFKKLEQIDKGHAIKSIESQIDKSRNLIKKYER